MMMPLFPDFFPPEVKIFFSDQSIDFTLGEDQFDLNQEQKDFLKKKFTEQFPKLTNIRQIHSNHILLISGSYAQDSYSVEKADGIITDRTNMPIAIRTADCLPIFMFDPSQKVIGLLHAGWRGTAKEIVSEAVAVMEKKWQTQPKDLRIAFGPAIRSCCYEVGFEFKDHFPEDIIERDDSYYLDLAEVNKKQFKRLGVREDHIHDCSVCTCCTQNYFSYRKEGTSAGRMLALMMLAE